VKSDWKLRNQTREKSVHEILGRDSVHPFPARMAPGLALDVIALAHRREYDVALVMSQDQDLSEVAEEIRTIAREQRRWLKIASAFPQSPTSRNRRGINKTDWIRIDRAFYDQCLDRRDYRRKRK